MQSTTINTFGNLTKQPASRTGKNNQPYIIFTVAHNPAEGQREFVKCFAWGNDQQRFAAKLQKGDRVHIIGESTERETKTGKIVFVKLGYFRKYDRTKKAAA
jgi:single-stranded DNA-binding protein